MKEDTTYLMGSLGQDKLELDLILMIHKEEFGLTLTMKMDLFVGTPAGGIWKSIDAGIN